MLKLSLSQQPNISSWRPNVVCLLGSISTRLSQKTTRTVAFKFISCRTSYSLYSPWLQLDVKITFIHKQDNSTYHVCLQFATTTTPSRS